MVRSNPLPGTKLKFEIDGDGTPDAILVGDSVALIEGSETVGVSDPRTNDGEMDAEPTEISDVGGGELEADS